MKGNRISTGLQEITPFFNTKWLKYHKQRLNKTNSLHHLSNYNMLIQAYNFLNQEKNFTPYQAESQADC